MNKKRLVLAGIAAIIALGITLCIAVQYKHQENTTKMLASIHELADVLNFAEHKGADYAADELLYLHTRSYTKDDLHLKWGEPNKCNTDPIPCTSYRSTGSWYIQIKGSRCEAENRRRFWSKTDGCFRSLSCCCHMAHRKTM